MIEPTEIGSLTRLIDSLVRKVGQDDPEALRQLQDLANTVQAGVLTAGRQMMGVAEDGVFRANDRYSSAQVGRALGVSGAAVRKRFRVAG